jgi:FlaG/FlaF family flagellin (archaellin)
MSLGTVLLIVIVLALLGALPTWRHSRNWGFAPSGIVGVVLVVAVVMLLAGRI